MGLVVIFCLWRAGPRDFIPWWNDEAARWREQCAVLALGLAVMVVVSFGWVEGGRDFRILAPHLLMALLLLDRAHRRWPLIFAVTNLVLLGPVYPTFVRFHEERFTAAREEIRQLSAFLRPCLHFDENASSAWQNTLLVHVDLLDYRMLAVPLGIGVSYVLNRKDQHFPLRSRYVLLRPADVTAVGPTGSLTRLAETPVGMLYFNGTQQTRRVTRQPDCR